MHPRPYIECSKYSTYLRILFAYHVCNCNIIITHVEFLPPLSSPHLCACVGIDTVGRASGSLDGSGILLSDRIGRLRRVGMGTAEVATIGRPGWHGGGLLRNALHSGTVLHGNVSHVYHVCT